MAVFSNTIITKKGHALVAKGMTGEQINFTKVRTSDYDYPSSTNFENLTVLGSIKQTVDISAVNIENESTVRVKAAILNTDVTTGYYVKNIGLYANDPDEGEILFSITTATTADFMAAYNGVNTSVLTVDLLTTVSNSENVNLTVSPGGLVTTEMIATETERGVISGLDIRKSEAAYILGTEYKGIFGSSLTDIEAEKVYYYWDNVKDMYIPYKALKTATKTTGYITPDASTFVEISNANNANIVYTDGPYTLSFNVKDNILHVHNDISTPMYSISTLVNTINKFCTQYAYAVPTGAFLAGFKAWKISSPVGVLDCYGIRSASATWGFYAGESNVNISPADYYMHVGNAHVKLVKI